MNRDEYLAMKETFKRFDRLCVVCGKRFTPTGKFNKTCDKCWEKNLIESRKRTIYKNSLRRKNKVKV